MLVILEFAKLKAVYDEESLMFVMLEFARIKVGEDAKGLILMPESAKRKEIALIAKP